MTNSSQSCLIGCKWSLLILFQTVIIWITEEARCSSQLGNINHPNGKFYPWIIITPFDDTYGHISAGWSYLIRVMNSQLIHDIISVISDNEREKSSLLQKSDKLSSNSRARHVPSSRVSRLANFSSLGIGLGLGTVAEASRRIVSFGNHQSTTGSVLLSEVIVWIIISWRN